LNIDKNINIEKTWERKSKTLSEMIKFHRIKAFLTFVKEQYKANGYANSN